MLLIRAVFRCKPGHARSVAERLRRTIPSMERDDGFRNCRVMVDLVAPFWSVVLEAEADHLDQFEHHATTFGGRAEVREAMAGYMEEVEGGYHEIYRILSDEAV